MAHRNRQHAFLGIVGSLLLIITLQQQYVICEECPPCSQCPWKDGKKSADCTNISLTAIPTTLNKELIIQRMDLSYNQIAEIRRDEFIEAGLTNLQTLYMKNCSLEELHRNAFNGMPILIELDLSFNRITRLEVGLFSGMPKIRAIILNNNSIESLDDNLFYNLTFLTKIELKYNKIHTIGLRTFMHLPVVSIILLASNQLKVLQPEIFDNLGKLASLTLDANPWNCTCELKEFREFTIMKNLYTFPTSCRYPPALEGKHWNAIKPDMFACRPRFLIPAAHGHRSDRQRVAQTVVAHSENITLTCRIEGSPAPEIKWHFNKKQLNYDRRFDERSNYEAVPGTPLDIITSNLTISGLKLSDRGTYECQGKNSAGYAHGEYKLDVPPSIYEQSTVQTSDSNTLIIFIVIAIILFLILLILIIFIYCYCKRKRSGHKNHNNNVYMKNTSQSDNGSVTKIDKIGSESMLEGGSVMVDVQKSLLTEINPVEKPPRRTDIDSSDKGDYDDAMEIKKTLLEETSFYNQDEETQSIALSDTTPRSRQTFVDDGYGGNLPPDLLAFPSRFPQSPSVQSSISNINDARMYSKSPISSPIYQHGPYNNVIPSGYRTLQHPKSGRTIAVAAANRSNSPFTPAPLIYPSPMVMKQGYVTIPRKPRTPSWSTASVTDFMPPSPTASTATTMEIVEPVYDNLGLRTTAAGNSVLNLNKLNGSTSTGATTSTPISKSHNSSHQHNGGNSNSGQKYSMKGRPLPETPGGMDASKLYEPIQEQLPFITSDGGQSSDREPLYIRSNSSNGMHPKIINSSGISLGGGGGGAGNVSTMERQVKIPPRPPPKPKKKNLTLVKNGGSGVNGSGLNGQGSTSQLFEDEGEDGTEV